MTSCPACAFPTSNAVDSRCPFCGAELLRQGPCLARFSGTGRSFEFRAGERLLATAERSDGSWRVRTIGGGTFSLTVTRDSRRTDVLLVDSEGNVVATMLEVGATMAASVLLCNSEERPSLIVRADGLGGLNAIAANGNVLLYAGRSQSVPMTLDVLITDEGARRPLIVMFSLMVALEAEEVGPLHVSSTGS